MSGSIKKFNYSLNATFNSILKPSTWEGYLLIGSLGNNGLFTHVLPSGEVIWERLYIVPEQNSGLINGVELEEGRVRLFGRSTDQGQRHWHIVVDIKKNGAITTEVGQLLRTTSTTESFKLISSTSYQKIVGNHAVATSTWLVEGIRLNRVGIVYGNSYLRGHFADTKLSDVIIVDEVAKELYVGYANVEGAKQGFIFIGAEGDATFSSIFATYFFVEQAVNTYAETAVALNREEAIIAAIYEEEIGENSLVKNATLVRGILDPENIIRFQQNISISFLEYGFQVEGIKKLVVVGAEKLIYVLGHLVDTEGKMKPFILKFNSAFRSLWEEAKVFDFEKSAEFTDFLHIEDEQFLLVGHLDGDVDRPLFIRTDAEFNTCKTANLRFQLLDTNLKVSNRTIKEVRTEHTEEWNGQVERTEGITIEEICEEIRPFGLQEPYLLQSPHLHLEVAGSQGSDSTEGLHSRWHLLKQLGNHLPKGNYANTTHHFNKPNDFVSLYRAPFVDIHSIYPIDEYLPTATNHEEAYWIYSMEGNIVFYLYWHDKILYQSLIRNNALSNLAEVQAFFASYEGSLLELEWKGQFAYVAQLEFEGSTNVKIEGIAAEAISDDAKRFISNRRQFQGMNLKAGIAGENMQSVRWTMNGGKLKNVKLYFYSDFIQQSIDTGAFTKIGDFALTKDTDLAYKRLEDTSRFSVHDHWHRFNAAAKVNVENYQEKWHKDDKTRTRLLQGVEKYIELSEDFANPLAIDTISSDQPDIPDMEVSYLDMLTLAGMDFHVARMLGLGHIDSPLPNDQPVYVYLITYTTLADLQDGQGARELQHLYMSLPTHRDNERLPEPISIEQINYGLTIQKNTPTPIQITDANGYTPDGLSRYINIFTKKQNDYKTELPNPFFDGPEFDAYLFTATIMAGIAYKKNGDADWRKPELSHDAIYKDPAGNPETTPLVFDESNRQPLYVHEEFEEGIHEYAVYGINIFSRVTSLSSSVATNNTQFTKFNSLLPPSDFRVQLIQTENPLLLTTSIEQVHLEQLNGDKTLVRLTFNYGYNQDSNYDFADQIEIFFREALPRKISGGIASITDLGDRVMIRTKPYLFESNGEIAIPNITSNLTSNFIGGVFTVRDNRYFIEQITLENNNPNQPIFTLLKEEKRELIAGALTKTYAPFEGAADDLFLAVENLAKAESWGTISNPLSTVVQIDDSQWTTKSELQYDEHAQPILDSKGEIHTRKCRGIWDTISIEQAKDSDNNNIDKTYKVTFNTLKLKHHTQWKNFDPDPASSTYSITPVEYVEWYKGMLRIAVAGRPESDKENLPVLAIEHIGDSTQNTVVYIYDEINNRQEVDEGKIPLTDLIDFSRFDLSKTANFYPSYRVYLHADASNNFTANTIMPTQDEGSKETLLAARALDSSNNYSSALSVPAILMAQELVSPRQPALPLGQLYATPPDQYNKSTFTLEVQTNHRPYAMIFYRADLEAILNVLYTPATIQEIRENLRPPKLDPHFTDRWNDLVNLTSYIQNTPFQMFPTTDGYGFPAPDKDGVPIDKAKLLKEIQDAFVPLTKAPVLYQNIETNIKIQATKPAIEIADNAGKRTVRFTDYTLEGGMMTSYFYAAREMGNKMQLGAFSPIMGPVQLVNTAHPEAPIVQKVLTQIADPFTATETAICFYVPSFPKLENIRRIAIYRTTKAQNALSIRLMGEPVAQIDLDDLLLQENPMIIKDDFKNDTFIPYGIPLYYRLVALRKIEYKDFEGNDVVDYVPSIPTKVYLSNVIDMTNPEAPEIQHNTISKNADEVLELELSWQETAYNSSYTLYQMNEFGNWTKLYENKAASGNANTFVVKNLVKKEEDELIYYRFKVSVENSAGLLNLNDKVLVLGFEA